METPGVIRLNKRSEDFWVFPTYVTWDLTNLGVDDGRSIPDT